MLRVAYRIQDKHSPGAPFLVWEQTKTKMNAAYSYDPTGVLFLTGVSAYLTYRDDDKFYYSPILGVDPDAGTIDLSPTESSHKVRYPAIKGNGSYTYPHADTQLEDDPRKVRKILSALLQGGFVQPSYRILKSPVWRNKTVGEILGSKEQDAVDEIAAKSFGSVKMYHGTSAVRWKTIKIQGLRPGSATGIDPEAYANDLIPGYSEHMVYLSTKVSEAEKYAARAASIDRSIAVVLEVEVNDFTKFRLDEDNAGWLSSADPDMPSDQQDIHFRGNWRNGPNAVEIARKFERKMLQTLRGKGTVAYEGRIPATNLRVYETFKPNRITKKEPSDQEYQDSLEKTRGTVKWEPTKVGSGVSLSTESRMTLRSKLIRLAHEKPELRDHLLPLLKEGSYFHALQKRHRDEANAKKRYLVKSLNKGGEVSKAPFTQQDWQHSAFEDKEKAEKRVTDLEKMNPGRKYTIVDDGE